GEISKKVQIRGEFVADRDRAQSFGTFGENSQRIRKLHKGRLRDMSDYVGIRLNIADITHTNYEPSGPRVMSAGMAPDHRRRPYCSSARRLAANQFLQPPAMVSPRPAAGDLATGHGADRPAYPDRRIDVRDPDTNRDHGSAGMHQDGNPSLLDREIWT